MKLSYVLLAIVGVVILFTVTNYYSARSDGARMDQEIAAIWEDNRNILSAYSLKVQEVAQVPSMYKDDLKEVVTGALQGRYGQDGSKATFQWIKEHNITLDAGMYKKIQQVIEAGRSKFENAQTRLLDVKRRYATILENDAFLTKGFWLKQVGYPRVPLNTYKIISNDYADDAFKTKKQSTIKLR